ncbi:MAG: dUTP diphosphatase [Deltaproteobacteria bacterium]|nr:dUTP diphosphatase [Deltaproteobacteria bacterium]
MNLEIKIKQLEGVSEEYLPRYMSEGASGMDLFATIETVKNLEVGQRALIPCGFCLEMPKGTEAQIRPRSGLAIKHGITCLNTPGTIDSDYRGQIQVILINLGQENFKIEPGMRIAQMVFQRIEQVVLKPIQNLAESSRSEGGFGSTGH